MSSLVLVSLMVFISVLVSGLNADDRPNYTPAPVAATTSYTVSSSASPPAAAHYQVPVEGSKLVYHGYYAGTCAQDGFYANGPYSLVVCSNGRAHIQPCAPGTRNAAVQVYVPGAAYQYTDFCNENLNDYAGTAKVVAPAIPYYPVPAVYPYYRGLPYVY